MQKFNPAMPENLADALERWRNGTLVCPLHFAPNPIFLELQRIILEEHGYTMRLTAKANELSLVRRKESTTQPSQEEVEKIEDLLLALGYITVNVTTIEPTRLVVEVLRRHL